MQLRSESFRDGDFLDEAYALGRPDETSHVVWAGNRNPHFAWQDLPAGTRSLALICHDPDVPSRPDDVNVEGRSVPADLPRVDFFHWVLVDLNPGLGAIAEGAFSDGLTPRGKGGPAGPHGTRQGLNNYTQWFEGDPDMGGAWFGYDGPCPPWNDSIVHHYVFTLFALGVERFPLEGTFDGAAARAAMADHVLGSAALTSRYTLTPGLGDR